MKIAVFGSDGQLGRDIVAALNDHEVECLPHGRADITDEGAVMKVVEATRPDCVINAAAMTNVDGCESEEALAFSINADGARHVADACHAAGGLLIHISTDYVFDGSKREPYVEEDPTNPLSVYGRSKLAGEEYVVDALDEHYIVRSSGLYGLYPCRGKGGANFVDTMLRLAGERDSLSVVSDEVLTPTYTIDLADVLVRLIEKKPPFGVYHATNDGECSWYEFAAEIFQRSDVDVDLAKTTAAAWGAPAKRPAYSVLANAALEKTGLDSMPHWRDALARYLAARRDDS